MRPFPPSIGDPVCPVCGGGPYTRHGVRKSFIRGLCVACWASDHARPEGGRRALPAHLKPAGHSAALAEARRARKSADAPVCGLPDCGQPCVLRCYGDAAEVWSRRCAAHQGMNVAVRSVRVAARVERRVCSGCGMAIARSATNRPKHSYCSSLCRRYVEFGPWSVPVRRRAVPPPVRPFRSVECAWCGGTFSTRHSLKRFCSARCSDHASERRRRARKLAAGGEYSRADVRGLWEAFDGSCAYCAVRVPFEKIQPDHVVALARGGSNDVSNLLPACGSCNADKRDLTLAEWSEYRILRELPPVVTSWDAADPRYAHLVLHGSLVEA